MYKIFADNTVIYDSTLEDYAFQENKAFPGWHEVVTPSS